MQEGFSPAAAGAGSTVPAVSERLVLARLALAAALSAPGVVGSDAGRLGTRTTLDGLARLPGVTAVVLPDGRYGVSLYLVARLVPLHPLAERVRALVARAAATAGLAAALGPVDIAFENVVENAGAPPV